ncbi:hypothetical protein [Rhodococcus qingshengii]|uniref:hypothetical protein n=1 Tax=Rhodococcus qingshengii TaxID=334542 RepID=UPI001ADEC61C|nr:hypothetical protein [Rhodococcus qingshengii]
MTPNLGPELATSSLIDEILAECGPEWSFGDEEGWKGYRNHAQRVFLFARELTPPGPGVEERIAIVAAFHDLAAIQTVDYLDVNLAPMRAWLAAHDRQGWEREIALAMTLHHRIRPYRGEAAWLVECIRRADWIEVTGGVLNFGLSRGFIRYARRSLPNRKFVTDAGIKIIQHALTHPRNPFPFWRSGLSLAELNREGRQDDN